MLLAKPWFGRLFGNYVSPPIGRALIGIIQRHPPVHRCIDPDVMGNTQGDVRHVMGNKQNCMFGSI